MSFEQRVVQLEETNAELVKEVVRVRDAAMGLNRMFPTVTEGRQTVADGQYFSVPGEGAYQRLYRRNGTQAQLIAEYPSAAALEQAITDAESDAEARMNAAADRAEVYADNKGFVARERLRQQATLDLDFASGDYAVDTGEKLRTTNAGEVLTVERATPKWVFGPNGKLREVPPNTLARQWNPVTGEPEGVLIEESRTNLLLWSEDFTQGDWVKSGTTIAPDEVVAPNGEQLADRVYSEESGGYVRRTISPSPSTTYTFSVYAKRAAGSGSFRVLTSIAGLTFDLVNKTISSNATAGVPNADISKAGLIELHDGWFRCSFPATTSESTSSLWFEPARLSEGDEVFIWGAQLEEGSTPSSYIPTQDAPVTRAADNVSRALGEEFNADGFTLVARSIDANSSSGGQPLVKLNNGTDSTHRGIGIVSGDDTLLVQMRTAEGTKTIIDAEGTDVAFSVNSNSLTVAAAIDGQAANLNITQSEFDLLKDQISDIHIGGNLSQMSGSAGTALFAIGGVSLFPRALSEAELSELTS